MYHFFDPPGMYEPQ